MELREHFSCLLVAVNGNIFVGTEESGHVISFSANQGSVYRSRDYTDIFVGTESQGNNVPPPCSAPSPNLGGADCKPRLSIE